MPFEIPPEKKELLAEYGRAVLECNKVEMYVGAILKQNKEPDIPDNFGPKIRLIDKYIVYKKLVPDIEKLNLDRIRLAHSFAINNSDGTSYLVLIKDGKAKNSPMLTERFLQDISNRAFNIGALLQSLGNLKHIEW